jgi:rifampicin phosphotransferase
MLDSFVTDWTPSERLPYYTRANAGEVLPDPASPLGWTLVFEGGLAKGWRQGFIDFGVLREDELDPDQPGCIGMFGGYFFISLSTMRLIGIRMGGTTEAIDQAFIGNRPDTPPYEPHPDDDDEECKAKVAETLGWVMTAERLETVEEDTARLDGLRAERPHLASISDAELVERMRSMRPELDNGFYQHDFMSLASSVGPQLLGGVCTAVGKPELMLDLISGLGDVVSAAPTTGLWALSRRVRASNRLTELMNAGADALLDATRARDADAEVRGFATELETFLTDHGYRGPNEWDIYSNSWEVHPASALALVDRLRWSEESESPTARAEMLRTRREDATEQVRGLIDDDELLATFESGLSRSRLFIPGREATKRNCVVAINEVRLAALEFGRRGVEQGALDEPHDVMMLLESELDDYAQDPTSLRETIESRKGEYAQLFDIEPPFIMHADKLPISTWRRRDSVRESATVPPGTVLTGGAGCTGVHTGTARIVTDPAQAQDLQPGDVLVAPLTDAAWTPLFLVAGAVVIDVGAMNSHAVVVCRELGIPCVVSVTDATDKIPHGATITVDGGNATVTLAESSTPLVTG